MSLQHQGIQTNKDPDHNAAFNFKNDKIRTEHLVKKNNLSILQQPGKS